MNIVQCVYKQAKLHPHKKAIIAPISYDQSGKISYAHYTFEQFVQSSERLSQHFESLNIQKGHKVLLFVKPSLEFSVLVFSLFSIGAIPVFMDPGVGRKNLLSAIAKVRPDVLIGEPQVHIMRRFFPRTFSSVKVWITSQKPSFFTSNISIPTLMQTPTNKTSFEFKEWDADTLAAIVYTSGATGIPKGVVYTHGMFHQQVQLLHQIMPVNEQSVDLSCFPLFSLFAIAMGMTSVIPWLDAAKPASVNPEFLYRHIQDQGVTLGTGSPAIWKKLAEYCIEKKLTLDSIKGIVMFGAPVSLKLHQMLKPLLPNGTTYTPYGATESLPVTWISGQFILEHLQEKTQSGAGTCIGKLVPETEALIVRSTDKVLHKLSDAEILPAYEVGELIVSGKQVTQLYFEHTKGTEKAKIYDDDKIWHRMGDLAYKDDEDYLWFCGRKVHAVGEFFSINCEAIFNHHPDVNRSALIQYKNKPAIVLERKDRRTDLSPSEWERFKTELKELASAYKHTQDIDTFFLYKDFPVDCRHNIKIDRQYLSRFFSPKPVFLSFPYFISNSQNS